MATILGQRFPIVTLDNKLTVVNYGSNHKYLFNDGNELAACTDDVCRATAMVPNHSAKAQIIVDDIDNKVSIDIPHDAKDDYKLWREFITLNHPEYENCKMWLDVFIKYNLSDTIKDDLNMIAEMDIIDIILVPRLLMETLDVPEVSKHVLLKARTCKVSDRVSKIIHADRFCGSDVTRYTDLGYRSITTNGDEKVPAYSKALNLHE